MLEVAYILVAIALIVCLVYLTITIQKAGRMIDETEKTIKTLSSDVDVTFFLGKNCNFKNSNGSLHDIFT